MLRSNNKTIVILDLNFKCTSCENSGEHFQIDHRRRGGRSDSVLITPNLIKNLQKNRKRIIAKGGQCNIQLKNVHKRKRQHFRDCFTTAIGKTWHSIYVFYNTAYYRIGINL